MTMPKLTLNGIAVPFRPPLAFYNSASKHLLKLCQSNIPCLLKDVRSFTTFHTVNDFGFYTTRLKCWKLNYLHGQFNFLRTSLKWEKCTSSRILAKGNCKRSQRYQSMRSMENITCDQLNVAALKETRRKVAKKMEQLKENVLTIPNALCVARIAATPFLGYLVIQESYSASLGIFVLAGITDIADGYIARTYPSQQSMIGSFLDPAADKILVATLFLTLTANGLIPVPLTSLIILRDICLLAAGFYVRYVSLPHPKTLGRYFDVSFATARLSPTTISKVNTLIQLSLVAFSLAAPVFGYVDHLFLKVLWCITGTSTVLSAGSYIYYKDTYKLLALNKAKKKIL